MPTAATGATPALTTLALSFATGDAPTLRAGERVELWVTSPKCSSVVLLPDVTVQSARAGRRVRQRGQRPEHRHQRAARRGRTDRRRRGDRRGALRAGILTGSAPATPEPLGDLSACVDPTR